MQVAQAVHAAGESVRQRVPRGTHAVVLEVPDERALRAVATKLTELAVDYELIIEPDAPLYGQATAIGVRPVRDRRTVARALSQLPLLGRARCAA